jgi:hypothetical protein
VLSLAFGEKVAANALGCGPHVNKKSNEDVFDIAHYHH